jgi:chromosome segregation ATPase
VDFGAITKMIDEMVAILEAEEADDAKHKTWCQGEFATTADSTEKATANAASLEAAISETTDEAATLAEDIAALTAGIAALDKDVATSTEQRKGEHAEYLETIALTEAAIQLVGKAKNRLQKFYNPALYKAPPKKELSAEDKIISNLGAFVQIKAHGRVQQPVAPDVALISQPYEKKTEKSGGVMGLMDMLVGDLKSSLQEAEHDEKTAQGDYTELMADSQETRASDSKSITDKSSAKAGLESKVVDLKEQKALTVEELGNLAQYTSEIHASCDFILENFKLRSDARTNEVESLKNAKAVLAGASYSF